MSRPDGNTEFQFKGYGNNGFMLWTTDGSPDTFRLILFTCRFVEIPWKPPNESRPMLVTYCDHIVVWRAEPAVTDTLQQLSKRDDKCQASL